VQICGPSRRPSLRSQTLFSNARKLAQQTSQRLISGHCALVAWWTLKHAGVLHAIIAMEAEAHEGLEPRVHAVRKNMAPDLLVALVDYLAAAGLLTVAAGKASLTPEGRALLEHDDGILDLVRAYQPALAAAEHLLAKLKTPIAAAGGFRKSDTLANSRVRRQSAELFPAVQAIVKEHRCSHLLDLQCGAGELLISLAENVRSVVAVGIAADDESAHRANTAFEAVKAEKRLIAIPADPADILTDTPRAFERIGISRQLWSEIDLLLLPLLFADAHRDAADVAKMLAAARTQFPRAAILVVEPVDGPRLAKNYFAPELTLLLRLTRAAPWSVEQWRDVFAQARLPLTSETGLTVDGLTLFLSLPARPEPAPSAGPAAARR
jgi:hypothetical protein